MRVGGAWPLLRLLLWSTIVIAPFVLVYVGWDEVRLAKKNVCVTINAKEQAGKVPADTLVEITRARLDFTNACPIVREGQSKAHEIFVPVQPSDAPPGAPFQILLESSKSAWLDPAKASGGADITLFGETTKGSFLPWTTIGDLKKHYGPSLPAEYVVLHEHLKHRASTGYALIAGGLAGVGIWCWLIVRAILKAKSEAAAAPPPNA